MSDATLERRHVGDTRIIAGDMELDAQERALAANRHPQLVGWHARAAHVLRGDVPFVDDADPIEVEDANILSAP